MNMYGIVSSNHYITAPDQGTYFSSSVQPLERFHPEQGVSIPLSKPNQHEGFHCSNEETKIDGPCGCFQK